eukprot:scaffold261_cov336-Pavlova_lutheri.AAC.79
MPTTLDSNVRTRSHRARRGTFPRQFSGLDLHVRSSVSSRFLTFSHRMSMPLLALAKAAFRLVADRTAMRVPPHAKRLPREARRTVAPRGMAHVPWVAACVAIVFRCFGMRSRLAAKRVCLVLRSRK